MLPIYEIRRDDLSVKRNKYELDFPDHMHNFIEIIYAYKGVQHLKIENKSYLLSAGCAAVIFPDTIHSYYSSDKKDTDVLILMCEPKLFGALFPDLKRFKLSEPFIDSALIPDELRSAFNSISPSQKFDMKFSWTCVIMSYILDILKPEHSENAPVVDITYKLMKYIEESFTEDITRESLARKFNVSECYISKIFTNRFRMNLRTYLGLKRAEYAASLIRTSDATFTDISIVAGFGSLRSFNRVFKDTYGMTPNEYKKNIFG